MAAGSQPESVLTSTDGELSWDDKMLVFTWMMHQRRAVRGVPGYTSANTPVLEPRLRLLPDEQKQAIRLEMKRFLYELQGMERNDDKAPEISEKSLMAHYKQ